MYNDVNGLAKGDIIARGVCMHSFDFTNLMKHVFVCELAIKLKFALIISVMIELERLAIKVQM